MSCDTTPGFPSATLMANMALNNAAVWEEICAIQQAVLAASSQCQVGGGQLCTTVGGTTPMTFVSGITSIAVTDGGTGYYNDTPKAVFVRPLGSSGTTATGTLNTNGGAILSINMIGGGTGYLPVRATIAITTSTGSAGVLRPLVNASGQIVAIDIANAGTAYIVGDTLAATRAVASNALYVDAVLSIASVSISGQIQAVTITNPGSGYQDSVATVSIVSTLNPSLPYPLGAGFASTVVTDGGGVITGVIVTNTGAGYATYPPYLIITDPGVGATTSVTLTGTAVSAVAVLTRGANYTQAATGTILNPATAAAPNPPTDAAIVTFTVPTNTYGTTPALYWQVWQGTATDKQIQTQMNAVLAYFRALGYTIVIQSNPLSLNNIQWRICW